MENLVLTEDLDGPPMIHLGGRSEFQSYVLTPLSSPNSASPRTSSTTSRGPSLVRDSHAVVHQRYHSIGNDHLSKAARAAESSAESPHPIPHIVSETAGAESTCASDRCNQSHNGSREHDRDRQLGTEIHILNGVAAHDDDRDLTVSVAMKFRNSECDQHPFTAPRKPHVANPVRPARSQSANLEEVWKSMHRTSYIFTRSYVTLEVKYVLKERLGDGAMGVVRRCVERGTGQEWACKSIDKNLLRSQEDVAGLRFEVAAMKSLAGHPCIIGLYDLVEDETVSHDFFYDSRQLSSPATHAFPR